MSFKKNILVTGANGQLGLCFKDFTDLYPEFNLHFASREQVSLSDTEAISALIDANDISVIINCAAYTAVDKAEEDRDAALEINGFAVGRLAEVCKTKSIKLVHFSTDYVFNGTASEPYQPNDETNPVNFYGETKLQGERSIREVNTDALIIRTSWVYSPYGKNFVKTMKFLMESRPEISVVSDQVGCPTYAADLAKAVLDILSNYPEANGIYHYCNQGIISWYEFASAVKEIFNSACIVNPIPTTSYPTPAARPAYSALDTEAIQSDFNLQIPEWKESLKNCLFKM